MLSTFHGIEVGKKGLVGNNVGMDTVGHNLTNIETEGYSRQNVNMTTWVPLYEPSATHPATTGQIGSGVIAENIERIRNSAIEGRINDEQSSLSFWETKQQFLEQVEMIYNEPSDAGLRSILDAYWESWQSVSNDPSESAAREELVQRAQSVTDTVNAMYFSLRELRENADLLVYEAVTQINSKAEEIAALNVQIIKSEALGDSPNDLYDRRDLLIHELSEKANINVEWGNDNEVIVYIGAENLVQGGKVNKLQLVGNAANDGYYDVQWTDGRTVEFSGGEIHGLLTVRDEDIKTAIDELDAFTVNFVSATNEIHRDGFGLNVTTDVNFFEESYLSQYANGDYDFNNDGAVDGTAIFKVSGTEEVDTSKLVGTAGELNLGSATSNGDPISIAYAADDTIQDVIDRINQSDANVNVYVNHKDQLTFKATLPGDDLLPKFSIQHLEDSGNFLVGIAGILNASGADGAFDYQNVNAIEQFASPTESIDLTPSVHPAGWFAVDSAIIADSNKVAASGAYETTGDGDPDRMLGLGDNTQSLLMADLRYKSMMVESELTFGEYYQSMVANMATRSETAGTNVTRSEDVLETLENMQDQYSGVNVDEELTKMMMYQHGYNAAARLITTIDGMLETLINMGA